MWIDFEFEKEYIIFILNFVKIKLFETFFSQKAKKGSKIIIKKKSVFIFLIPNLSISYEKLNEKKIQPKEKTEAQYIYFLF